MDENKERRSAKVTVVMTPQLHQRLTAYARQQRWTMSTAADWLLRMSLFRIERERRWPGGQVPREDMAEWLLMGRDDNIQPDPPEESAPDSTAPARRPGSGPVEGQNKTAVVQERQKEDQ